MKKGRIILFIITAMAIILSLCACEKKPNTEQPKDTAKCEDFELVSPASDAVSVEVQPLFEWETSKNALKYTLTIATTEDFSDENVYEKTNIASPYHTLSDITLDYSTTYYWKVEAIGRGEGNKKLASNCPLKYTTQSDTRISIFINHVSYLSSSKVTVNYDLPASSENAKISISKDSTFENAESLVLEDELSAEKFELDKDELVEGGSYYIRISADIDEKTYYSDINEIFIGENILLHDFSAESGSQTGINAGVRDWTGGDQLTYSIVDQTLKINFTTGSFLDYTIVDIKEDQKANLTDVAYCYLRYKSSNFVGALLCKMRGDDSVSSNWKDYSLSNINGNEEWQQALIAIDVSSVNDFNRVVFGIMSSISGEIFIDDIYFIKPFNR